MNSELKHIFNQFKIASEFESYTELNSGHINDTFLIKTTQKPDYVLQKINKNVFRDAPKLITNKVLISNHLQKKQSKLPLNEMQRKVLCFVDAKSGKPFYKNADKNYWNLSVFIENSVTYEKVPNSKIAFQAGKATGEFLSLTTDFEVNKLTNIFPGFHSVSKRFLQFSEALSKATKERINIAENLINFTNSHIAEMCYLDDAIDRNKLPIRVTHNDTKISNILFSKEDIALCMIDTDTVMQGVIHYDYGDAIRTICNTSNEDGTEIDLISFNFDFFKKYTQGFFQEIKENISSEEIKYLPLSIKIMPFIIGLRFLTDFLNDDVYYKANYPHHNFDRAKNQYTLVKKIKDKYSEIQEFIKCNLV